MNYLFKNIKVQINSMEIAQANKITWSYLDEIDLCFFLTSDYSYIHPSIILYLTTKNNLITKDLVRSN